DLRGAIWQTVVTKSAVTTDLKSVGALYDCAGPSNTKVDAKGNLWSVCQGTNTINMYAPKATTATIVLQEERTEGTTRVMAFPSDVAVDGDGNVYVSNGAVDYVDGSKFRSVIDEVDVFRAKASCGSLPCNKAFPDATIVDPHANLNC